LLNLHFQLGKVGKDLLRWAMRHLIMHNLFIAVEAEILARTISIL
jgi:hypothetical protein